MKRRSYGLFVFALGWCSIVSPLAPAQELEESLERLNALIKDEPSRYHHDRAEVHFRLGHFRESIKDYDTAADFGWPHDEDSCWERGLAQYYAGDFSDGRDQFYRYHRVGPLDIENGLWRFLCIAEEEGIEKARNTVIEYSRRVRVPFPELLALYLGNGSAEAVLKAAQVPALSPEERTFNLFNASYYLAKYYEIVGEKDEALIHARQALKHKIPHFMYACAEIDAKRMVAAVESPEE